MSRSSNISIRSNLCAHPDIQQVTGSTPQDTFNLRRKGPIACPGG